MLRSMLLSLFAISLVACTPATAEPVASPEKVQVAKAPSSQPAAKDAKKTAIGEGETPAERGQVDKDGVIRRGAKLSSAKALTVAACQKDAAKLDKKTVKIEGNVAELCAKKGCWWVLGDDKTGASVRITAKDYGFFIPKDATGRRGIAEGVLEVKHMSEEERAHMAEDSGDPNAKIPAMELRLAAAAIEMHPAQPRK